MAGNTICPHNAGSQVVLRDRQVPCLLCGALLQAGGADSDGLSASYPGDPVSAAVAALDANLNLPTLPL